MKAQMRISMTIVISIFLVVYPSWARSTDAVGAPASADIYTSTFFEVNPPIACPKCEGLHCGFSTGILNFMKQDTDRITKSLLAPDSMFKSLLSPNPILNRLREIGSFVNTGQQDLLTSVSPDGSSMSNLRQRKLEEENVDIVELIRAAKDILFGNFTDTLTDESFGQMKRMEQADADGEVNHRCENEQGNGKCLSAALASGYQFNPVTKLAKWKGLVDIILCIVAEILRTKDSPVNIGTIACQCAQKFPAYQGVCEFVSVATTFLACTAKSDCSAKLPKPYVPPVDQYVNLPMVSTLPTPLQIPKDVIAAERQTYYLLYKSVSLLSYDAVQATCDSLYNTSSSISGWDVQLTANLVEPKINGAGQRVPFARMTSRPNAHFKGMTDFLISVRGTMTGPEWGIDFSYSQIFGEIRELGAVPLHRGFAALASTAWALFQTRLQEASDAGQLGLITITGHSLGGGVASVLGHLASKQFSPFLPTTSIPRVRVVSFGAPRAGGPKLMSSSKTVSVRTVGATFDPVSQLPCDSMLGCAGDAVPIPTARDKTSKFAYSSGPGIVPITPLDVPPVFSAGALPNIRVLVWHICAYDCWTSMHADPEHLGSCHAQSSTTTPTEVCSYLTENSL